MSNPLSREARDAMRARVEAACVGPWFWRGSPGEPGYDLGSYVQGDPAMGSGSVVSIDACDDCLDNFGRVHTHCEADAEFIAAARTDVPTLLDALDAAEALVSTLGSALSEAVETFDDWVLAGERLSVVRDSDRVKVARAALASYQEWEKP